MNSQASPTNHATDYHDKKRVITLRLTVTFCILWLIVIIGLVRSPKTYSTRPPLSLTSLRINPNLAEPWELSTLPSIGDTKASAIIDYRYMRTLDTDLENPAPAFAHADELLHVRGIGPKTVSKIKPYLRFDNVKH